MESAAARRDPRRFRLRATGYSGGQIADHEQAIMELGERSMNEAKGRAVGRGVDLELEMIPERPGPVAPAER
jgi:hypothetical protein